MVLVLVMLLCKPACNQTNNNEDAMLSTCVPMQRYEYVYMLYVNLMHYDMILYPCLVCMIYIYNYKTVFHFTCSEADENHECYSGAFFISEEGG